MATTRGGTCHHWINTWRKELGRPEGLPVASVVAERRQSLVEAVKRLELSAALPPSYCGLVMGLGTLEGPLQEVEYIAQPSELEWFGTNNSDWIKCYTDCLSKEELNQPYEGCVMADLYRCIQASPTSQGSVILLNPIRIDARGEWQAIYFNNWNPGPVAADDLLALIRQYRN